MRRLSLAIALIGSLFALPAQAANFTAKDASAATIIFTNPGNCTTGCTPIFSWADSTGANLVAVLTAGADAASNTATGGIVYNRNMVYNGTTWDRWQGAISIASGKVASGAFASGSIASGAFASGALSSGSVASGAFASGALAAGSVASGAMVDLGAQADAAWTSGSGSLIAVAKTIANNTAAAIPAGTSTIGNVGPLAYPIGATPITASATGTTGATTATLAGTTGKTTYICGYSIRANATAATTVTNTITGVITATLSSIMWVAPAASGIGIDEQIFSPCIPASATNTGIAIVSGAPGTGGNVSSKGWGYQL